MRKTMWLVVSLCAMLAVAMWAASRPEVGQPAPEFTLNSQDGTPVSLKDYRGKWVVLYFYPKDMTSGCTLEAHNFERDLAKYQQHNAVILGVSVDSVESHKQFCVKESLSFKLLSDSSKTVTKLYGTLRNLGVVQYASRETFLIDPQGSIVKVFADVKPSTHSGEVLAAIEAAKK